MRTPFVMLALGALLAAPGFARGDDLAGAERLLCTSRAASLCRDGGDCTTLSPGDLNIPRFFEIDIAARRLSATKASGEERSSIASILQRAGGEIVLQGLENGRAYSIQIDESTGEVAAAIVAEGEAIAAFGSCTPLAPPTQGRQTKGDAP